MPTVLVPIKFHKIMQTRSYTVVILGNDEKRFAIYTDPLVGKVLQTYLTSTEKPRPLTHDLMNMMLSGLETKVLQVVISELQDTVYYARLFLEQQKNGLRHIIEIDARPSDCLSLALMHHAHIYCTRNVFEKTIAVED